MRKTIFSRAPVLLAAALTTQAAFGTLPAVAQPLARPAPIKVLDVAPTASQREAEITRLATAIEASILDGATHPDPEGAVSSFVEAVDFARGLLRLDPESADAHYLFASALGYRLESVGIREKVRMADEVHRAAERALEIDPDHAGAHHVIGRINAGAMRLGRVERFIARRLLGAESMDGVSWQVAEHHLLRARELDPDNPRYSMELSALYRDTGRPHARIVELRTACSGTVKSVLDERIIERAQRELDEAIDSERRLDG